MSCFIKIFRIEIVWDTKSQSAAPPEVDFPLLLRSVAEWGENEKKWRDSFSPLSRNSNTFTNF